ncbi:hypothetical protein ACFE04_009300 [Oxalis oulophora]
MAFVSTAVTLSILVSSLSNLAGKYDGSSEVQLGHTHVMAFVTTQLLQPYKERPNEGSLAIFTEFSPMADPSFEPGRPGESAVELGRIINRGLRESKAVDTESLCVLADKLVWAIRVDLHILDNGGNLVDAANIAALTALMTFRRPDCTLGGEDGQQVTLHPPEIVRIDQVVIHRYFHRTSTANSVGFCRIDNHCDTTPPAVVTVIEQWKKKRMRRLKRKRRKMRQRSNISELSGEDQKTLTFGKLRLIHLLVLALLAAIY